MSTKENPLTTDHTIGNLPDRNRERRGHDFWPPAAELAVIPRLYETDDSGPMGDRVVHLHYFTSASDWWLIEVDTAEARGFGYVCLNGDIDMAEWGYVDLTLVGRAFFTLVERDLHWVPRPAREVLPAEAWVWND